MMKTARQRLDALEPLSSQALRLWADLKAARRATGEIIARAIDSVGPMLSHPTGVYEAISDEAEIEDGDTLIVATVAGRATVDDAHDATWPTITLKAIVFGDDVIELEDDTKMGKIGEFRSRHLHQHGFAVLRRRREAVNVKPLLDVADLLRAIAPHGRKLQALVSEIETTNRLAQIECMSGADLKQALSEAPDLARAVKIHLGRGDPLASMSIDKRPIDRQKLTAELAAVDLGHAIAIAVPIAADAWPIVYAFLLDHPDAKDRVRAERPATALTR